MRSKKVMPDPERAYLKELYKHLIWYYPPRQVKEIIMDYQEFFTVGKEKGVDTDSLIEEWGHPKTVVLALNKENPFSRLHLYRQAGLILTSIICFISCFYHFLYGVMGFLIFESVILFTLLHGTQRLQIEQGLPRTAGRSLSVWLFNILVSISVIMLEVGMQYLSRNIDHVPENIGGLPIGYVIDMICVFCIVSTAVFFIWLLRYTMFQSIRYYGGLIHSMGAILFMLEIRMILRSMDLATKSQFSKDILECLSYYGMGIIIAVCFGLYRKIAFCHGSED